MRQLKITRKITSRDSQSLDKYLNDISKISLLTPQEEIDLAQRIRTGDQQALDKLTRANLRFVVSVAKQYQNQGIPLSDLINEGNMGLIKACTRFDETRGFKFISYAVWWIRQAILQAIVEQSRIVRLPLNKVGSYNKVNDAFTSFVQKHEREPSLDELSAILEMKKNDIKNMIRGNNRHVSMDAPLKDDDGSSSMLEVMSDSEGATPDSLLMTESLKNEMSVSFNYLTPREVEIISLYYGLNRRKSMTLVEIGDQMELTRERVRQIKESALRKLRISNNKNSLRGYLG